MYITNVLVLQYDTYFIPLKGPYEMDYPSRKDDDKALLGGKGANPS